MVSGDFVLQLKSHNLRSPTNPNVIKNALNNILTTNHIAPEKIFTDASKSIEGVGCAVVSSHIKQYKLSPLSSIHTAELYAILQALKYVNSDSTDNQKFVILTDSLSSIQTIQSVFTKHPLGQTIETQLDLAMRNGKTIDWYPGK
ncbi:hypothetical protein JTB14_032248 [Gonioctena quinquepunctata]|nr:hypothetical protein JTB14_032248 [Gonioctena quinquepunctata]